jgi:hypothetical protein
MGGRAAHLTLSMKNVIHTIASFCFVIWLTGVLLYKVNNMFHLFLLVAGCAALILFLMSRPKSPRRNNPLEDQKLVASESEE